MRPHQFLAPSARGASVAERLFSKLGSGRRYGGVARLLANRGVAFWTLALLFLLAFNPGRAFAAGANFKLEALLVWGTNERKSPEPTHKPLVDLDIRRKLEELPLKWTNYFVVNRKFLEVAENAANKVAMSEKCEVEVKNLGNDKVEIALFGKRKQVMKRIQAMPKGETLVLGGNAPNSTAWLVVLRRTQ